MTTQPIEIDSQSSLIGMHQKDIVSSLDFALDVPGVGSLLLPQNEMFSPIQRLLVLIPDEDVNETLLARSIWSLAAPHGLSVLLVGTVWRGDIAYAHRRLITLATQIRNGRIQVATTIQSHNSWLQVIAEKKQPGDLIICHAQQKISTNGLKRQQLSQVLLTTHQVPIYVLNGFYSRLPLEVSTIWGKWFSIVVPVLIIVGFFLFQSWMNQWRTSGIYLPTLILSVLIEAGLIAVWEGVFDLI